MTDFDAVISDGANDARWREGAGDFNVSSTLTAGYWDASNGVTNFFIRYPNVTIPQGATISAATFTVIASGNWTNTTVNLRIRAIDSDNAAAPTTYAGAEAATRTSASVAWANVAAHTQEVSYTSPDFASVVQEVVDRAGWSSGNALVIYVEDDGSTASSFRMRAFYGYENDAAKAPTLHVEYTEAAVGHAFSQAVVIA